ncbi:hypothetical protein AWM70_06450 [Paenibacillus yonginensis]|uniref:DNA alkylation repair protein n=1 Tax=Paenibacillus yonginensis TaxID=1462996 RepID=A0A1B1MYK8_9BACL|nr:DNA alkylation repair protein [Paenibacillus yonginensis]ANS74268.1 hypothetical protein AWM70_06450 [Paenibacillus yonginensis]
MAEPLKNVYNKPFIRQLADKLHRAYPPFDTEGFIHSVLDEGWEGLELKARMRKITETLGRYLPSAYPEAIAVLFAIDGECSGFPYLIFPDFVEVFGQGKEDWELSMQALERFTPKSSAEFAVRPFLLRDPERTMKQMLAWAGHPDEHVRRLASEGCRPRLPWGQALGMFKKDPAPILPVLERLKADPSLYVRKSVANNLNDMAKDHPDLVIELARKWRGSAPETDWIIRHACRNLIRKAVPEVLALFGYADPEQGEPLAVSAELSANPDHAAIGGQSELSYELRLRDGEAVHIRLEYGVDFVKAGGRVSRKLFLLSDKTVPGGTRLAGVRTHRWANLTTRRHYPGQHRLVLLVNGREIAQTQVLLSESEE